MPQLPKKHANEYTISTRKEQRNEYCSSGVPRRATAIDEAFFAEPFGMVAFVGTDFASTASKSCNAASDIWSIVCNEKRMRALL